MIALPMLVLDIYHVWLWKNELTTHQHLTERQQRRRLKQANLEKPLGSKKMQRRRIPSVATSICGGLSHKESLHPNKSLMLPPQSMAETCGDEGNFVLMQDRIPNSYEDLRKSGQLPLISTTKNSREGNTYKEPMSIQKQAEKSSQDKFTSVPAKTPCKSLLLCSGEGDISYLSGVPLTYINEATDYEALQLRTKKRTLLGKLKKGLRDLNPQIEVVQPRVKQNSPNRVSTQSEE